MSDKFTMLDSYRTALTDEQSEPLSRKALLALDLTTRAVVVAVRLHKFHEDNPDAEWLPQSLTAQITEVAGLEGPKTVHLRRRMKKLDLVDSRGKGPATLTKVTLPQELRDVLADIRGERKTDLTSAPVKIGAQRGRRKPATKKGAKAGKPVRKENLKPTEVQGIESGVGGETRIGYEHDTAPAGVDETQIQLSNVSPVQEDDSPTSGQGSLMTLEDAARIIGMDPSALEELSRKWQLAEDLDIFGLSRVLIDIRMTESTWRRRDRRLVTLLAGPIAENVHLSAQGDDELKKMLWAELIVRGIRFLAE